MIFKSKYTNRRFLSMSNRDFYDAGYEAAKDKNDYYINYRRYDAGE